MKNTHILVVDDNEVDLCLMSEVLAYIGIRKISVRLDSA
ncbi:MAG: CheY-like chemotaxis protein [Sediminicola sp.]|jgi:CheY-like chemotaxis protein